MKHISYCTTCKGRLWQLKQTLPINIKLANEDIEIVLLDYHSQDGLREYILENYQEYLADGRLRYYRLITDIKGFDMAYAKHIAHMLGEGRVLFNLDADNFIGASIPELMTLPPSSLLVANKIVGTATSRGGRIGMSKSDYVRIGGYNTAMLGMFGDDGELVGRCLKNGMSLKMSNDRSIPIQQDEDYKHIHVIPREPGFRFPKVVELEDYLGRPVQQHLNLRGSNI